MLYKNKTISLVIADTDSYKLARHALERTIEAFPVDDVLVFSDQPNEWEGFNVILVEKISNISDYNKIILKELPEHLKTDYALIIQYDGFVINPNRWSDFFFNFDYIGAPWPAGEVFGREAIVGNGGFSLRSKKIIECSVKYLPSHDFTFPEDAMVCRILRPSLEEIDKVVFAPVEVARHFSFELEPIIDIKPFGFHGLFSLASVYQNEWEFLLENLPNRCFKLDSLHLKSLTRGFSKLDNQAQLDLAEKVRKLSLDAG